MTFTLMISTQIAKSGLFRSTVCPFSAFITMAASLAIVSSRWMLLLFLDLYITENCNEKSFGHVQSKARDYSLIQALQIDCHNGADGSEDLQIHCLKPIATNLVQQKEVIFMKFHSYETSEELAHTYNTKNPNHICP